MGRNPKEDRRFQSRAVEIIFNSHISGSFILETYRKLKVGLYAGFVKWHLGSTDEEKNPHTHVAIVLREKPKYEYHKLKKIFQVGEVEPHLVNPIGKGNAHPTKKLNNYVHYLTDGHDNGHYTDTWNYKYDHELEQCDKDARFLLLLSRNKTMEEIISDSDWNNRAYYYKNKKKIDAMIYAWRQDTCDQTVHHLVSDFKPEVQEAVNLSKSLWDPRKQSLVIKGPSNVGKTELAKAILKQMTGKNPLFMRSIHKLAFRKHNQPIIMDDMNFNAMSRSKMIHLTDIKDNSDIRILYGIHTIDAFTPQIFTTNEEMDKFLPEDTTEAIKNRLYELDVTRYGKLYPETKQAKFNKKLGM